MICPYCGGEIEHDADKCSFCGRHITYQMKREIEKLNKKGCPKCGSSNVTFRREDQGEIWDERSRRHILRTVGLCGDCGHTWYTDLDLEGQEEPPKPPEPPQPPTPPTPPDPPIPFWRRHPLLTIAALIFIVFLLSHSCGNNGGGGKTDSDFYENDTDGITESTEIEDPGTDGTITEEPELAYLSIDPAEQNGLKIENAEFLSFSGNIKKEDQDDVYSFTPDLEGVYRIELSEIHNNVYFKMSVYNSEGERVKLTYAGNGEGLTVSELKKGQDYKIHITQSDDYSPYSLTISKQKKPADISDYTVVTDSIEFTDQDNIYTFTVPIDGKYRFEFSEIRDNKYMKLSVFNHLGERLDSTYAGNGEGLTMDLDSDEDYTIHVVEENGFSSYDMKIGRQKDMVNISDYDGVYDSIEFTDQDNVYQYSPPYDGDYEFTLSELKAENYFKVSVYNRLGERLASTYCYNEDSLYVRDLNANETYTIHVQEENGFSVYRMTIEPR